MYLYITVDTNDGDYVSDLTKITEHELEEVRRILAKLPPSPVHWETRDCGNYKPPTLTPEEVKYLENRMPYCEYGFHTLEEVFLFPSEKQYLF